MMLQLRMYVHIRMYVPTYIIMVQASYNLNGYTKCVHAELSHKCTYIIQKI